MFAVRSYGSNKTDKMNLTYNVCNKGGHDSKSFFQVIGYPKWLLERNKAGGGSNRGSGKHAKTKGKAVTVMALKEGEDTVVNSTMDGLQL